MFTITMSLKNISVAETHGNKYGSESVEKFEIVICDVMLLFQKYRRNKFNFPNETMLGLLFRFCSLSHSTFPSPSCRLLYRISGLPLSAFRNVSSEPANEGKQLSSETRQSPLGIPKSQGFRDVLGCVFCDADVRSVKESSPSKHSERSRFACVAVDWTKDRLYRSYYLLGPYVSDYSLKCVTFHTLCTLFTWPHTRAYVSDKI
ncbi:uncharacterized protein LOC117217744 [Megalopta genalis]|uniref:uncharacterized protein LOC117217744 n=1 Tax=Megalopta genalis TaxID=115081 RepID=UPI003FD3931E